MDESEAGTARAWLDVDLSALVANARDVIRSAGRPLMPMVKANAYGLGAVPVARALAELEPWGFGVATSSEGSALRQAGIDAPILVVTPHQAAWTGAMLSNRLTPLIGDLDALDDWLTRAGGRPFHVAIDSGMHRAGFASDDRAALDALRRRLQDAPGWEGLATHFHSADCDDVATRQQASAFAAVAASLPRRPPLVHLDNSAAALSGHAGGDLARPGIYLYGGQAGSHQGRPVASFRARVVSVLSVKAGGGVSYGATWRADAPSTIATIAAGYADGIPRALSNAGRIAVGSRMFPIRGAVTMDMTMIETDESVTRGDVATVFGDLPTVTQQARLAGTIDYELLTGVGPRVVRRYLHGTTPGQGNP